jgi:hypothetical protein
MEQDNKKPKILGLAVYIPLVLTIFFMFLAIAESHFSQIYVFGFIPNPFYNSDPFLYSWGGFGVAIFTIAFWLLTIFCLITTVAMIILRASLVKLRQDNKPVSRKANIIAIIFILLIIGAVWYIYKFGIH